MVSMSVKFLMRREELRLCMLGFTVDLSVSCFVYVTTTCISSGSGISFSGKVLREKTFVNFAVV